MGIKSIYITVKLQRLTFFKRETYIPDVTVTVGNRNISSYHLHIFINSFVDEFPTTQTKDKDIFVHKYEQKMEDTM